jgi:flagellar basal-body rod protein FlgG
MWIAASGMEAQQARSDNIANNMANVNTTAFKKGVTHFEDMLYQTLQSPGSDTNNTVLPVGIQMGTGVRMASASKVFTQGPLESASSDLDLAIEGRGFFQVQLKDGTTAYTRDGHFSMDGNGKVVTNDGLEVIGFPSLDTNATSITIGADGSVNVFVDGESVNKGTIQIARVPNPEGLAYMGNNLYLETVGSGTPQTGTPGDQNFGNVAQHYLEGSNVEIVNEMVDLIAAQRAYELNSKSVKTADEMLRMAANLK